MSYLQSFPFDKLKIDQSFVQDLTATEGSKLIVRAIVNLGNNLGMQTTAEGVETIAQFNQAAAEGCNEVQGHFVSEPVSATQVLSVIFKYRNGMQENLHRIDCPSLERPIREIADLNAIQPLSILTAATKEV